jgi:hypothetical protein
VFGALFHPPQGPLPIRETPWSSGPSFLAGAEPSPQVEVLLD